MSKMYKAKVWERCYIWELRNIEFEAKSKEDAKGLIEYSEVAVVNYGEREDWVYDYSDASPLFKLYEGSIEEIE